MMADPKGNSALRAKIASTHEVRQQVFRRPTRQYPRQQVLRQSTPQNPQQQHLLYYYQSPWQYSPQEQQDEHQPGCSGPQGQLVNNANAAALGPESVANLRFETLPFYEVVAEICKPSVLFGTNKCTLYEAANGTRELVHTFFMSLEQINYISMNMDLSGSKHEYLYQAQLRICDSTPDTTVISDLYPPGFHLRVTNKSCQLPLLLDRKHSETEPRRAPTPINCSPYLRFNPTLENTIVFNWIPDRKKYVWGLYLVKKLSSQFLLDKLLSKEPRSSDETKKNIIEKMTDVDPDLATTSYRFSLVCPLGKIRMKIPAKSVNCNHLQCFDASVFILMNEKRPTWQCPICFNACNYSDIQIQSYFMDIVTSSKLSESSEEIEILADGTWKVYVKPENNSIEASTIDVENPINVVDLNDSLDDSDENKNYNSSKVSFSEVPKKYITPKISKENYPVTSTWQDEVIEVDSPSLPPETSTL